MAACISSIMTGAARSPAGVELERHDGGPAAAREEARGAAEPGAHVEDPAPGRDRRPPRERIDRGQSPVVVLVEVEQILRGQRPEGAAAPAGDGGEHLLLADRVPVVEVENAHGPRLKRLAAYDKSKRTFTAMSRGNP